ncbi:MAG: sulfite exporter TauE/SafE family protein [Rhodobacteraceae bacterium]|nr:sulfite exporter TauE/SafE family protein [Paracoccaceae bacterium]
MTEAFQAAIATEGLWLLAAGVLVAGIVRGFSGFGSAMIFLPVAGQVVPPVWALTCMAVFDLFGPLPNVPRALRDGQPRDVIRLAAGAVVALPVGVFVLTRVEPTVFRYTVSLVALLLLPCLILGLRYRGQLTRIMIVGTGALGGFLAGVAGIGGPPVILLYMASPLSTAAIRANLMLFLLGLDTLLICVFGWSGLLELVPVMIGVLLIVPYTLGNITGAAIFDPDRAQLYRWVAYGIIAASALSGLPLLD